MQTILFPEYRPITKLTGLVFWDAFWDCTVCHYHLWEGGVKHRDWSANNLMYYIHPETGKIYGTLIDFDLATLRGDRPSITHDRTGTIPFMALDLATTGTCNGKVKHLYRHDIEAACWMLFWISEGFESGKALKVHPLRSWASPSHKVSRDARLNYIHDTLYKGDPKLLRRQATKSHQSHAELNLILWAFHETVLKPPLKTNILAKYGQGESDRDRDHRALHQLALSEQFLQLGNIISKARSAADVT